MPRRFPHCDLEYEFEDVCIHKRLRLYVSHLHVGVKIDLEGEWHPSVFEVVRRDDISDRPLEFDRITQGNDFDLWRMLYAFVWKGEAAEQIDADVAEWRLEYVTEREFA